LLIRYKDNAGDLSHSTLQCMSLHHEGKIVSIKHNLFHATLLSGVVVDQGLYLAPITQDFELLFW